MGTAVLVLAVGKTPFYIVAGAFAALAVVVSAFGILHARFAGSAAASRLVMGAAVLLAAGAMATAVATATKPKGKGKAELHPITATVPALTASATAGGGGGGAQAGGGAAPAAPASHTVRIAAEPGQLAFDTKDLVAKSGKVTIDFSNPGPITHDVRIEQHGKDLGGTKIIGSGKATAVVDLKPGTYTFFCSVPGHRQAGMQGTLTVR